MGQFITGTITVHRGRINEFGLYTAGATISISAYNGAGVYLLADSCDAKEVGYTEDEAASKAIVSAATRMAQRLTGKTSLSGGEVSTSVPVVVVVDGVSSYVEVKNIANVCSRTSGVLDVYTNDYVQGRATLTVRGNFVVSELVNSLSSINGARVRSGAGRVFVRID